MNLTVSNEVTEQIYGPVEVNEDMTLSDLIALLELDCGFDTNKSDLYHNMDILNVNDDKDKLLKDLQIVDDDLLLIRNRITVVNPSELNDEEYVEQFRRELLQNQYLRQQLTAQIPGLEQMLQDRQLFFDRLSPVILQRRYADTAQLQSNPFGIPQDEYTKLMNDPETPENKKRLDELINQRAIDEQLRNAYEYTPEVFATVTMLYISLEINGQPVKAFVDSGAQMTIMSSRLAEQTGLSKLIDKRFIGEAHGVGTGKILGRIHQAQIRIETQYIPSSFVVLDTQIDLLIGLDMLKRHQACIDLEKNVLRIAGVETKFLGEADIPKDFESATTNTLKSTESASETSGTSATKTRQINAPQPGAVATPSTVPTSSHANTYPENTIKQLMDLGFSRNEVIKALDATGGNADFAASFLFN
ncbi:hypothetical protein KAFR_0B02300 [Kazachstania africana CBS 2517]|uniref:DNA damage-inducible protein 1 n=1 Tax=Kazachstania africana (strain ATCC 22294 / BCRC 22015 / CBS 2517 / CECT 1963 / NBRC 1671 / NRRL Y-8276) TaxID=1071382 RepID=H2AQ78_KAZAF|nr:hypothetical protein KAFR_0B02300 [Kazachstania africana CBS 2517]CCF56528.1 hypothetical protein KAFR_0B02300 [Kazachstania africana CBS 2517]